MRASLPNQAKRNAVRRRLGILSVLAALCFAAVLMIFQASNPWSEVSSKAEKEITAIVRRETTEPILSIRRAEDGCVWVTTGFVRSPLDGNGNKFRLKHSLQGWIIVEREIWLS